jgi:Tfp pilus assembly pilus retraction ATPase PilT
MEFDRVMKGISKFLNAEIYSKMNDWQEMIARIAVSRIMGNTEALKHTLKENSIVKALSIMDESCNVDVENLLKDIKTQLVQKGKLTFAIPLFGNLSFVPDDVDTLRRYIMEG